MVSPSPNLTPAARPARWTVLIVVLLVAFLAGCQRSGRSLILVTVPGLRSDAITADAMPRLTALMEEGSSTENLLTSAPDTVPALASLMTGQGVDRLNCYFEDRCRIPSRYPTLAELLASKGYRTAAFVGQGSVSPLTGLARGFETYLSPGSVGDSPILPDERARIRPRRMGWTPASTIADQVGAYLMRERDRGAQLIWIHLADLELAMAGSDPRQAYEKALGEIDETIGYLRDSMATFGLEDRSTFAVIALHGMSLGAEGEQRHGLTLDPAVVRVAATVVTPGRTRSNSSLPAGMAALETFLTSSLGFEGLIPTPDIRPPRCETRWPGRLYGWPNQEFEEQTPGAGPPRSVFGLSAAQKELLRRVGEANRARLAGDFAASIENLDRACQEAPRALAPRTALAGLLGADAAKTPKTLAALRGRLRRELEGWKAADTTTALDLARALKMLGLEKKALEITREALASTPSPGQMLAAAEMLTDMGAVEEAAGAIESVLGEESSPAPELEEWLGDLLLRTGNQYRARLAYEKALAVPRGKSPHVLAKLGDALAGLGEADAALQSFAGAVAMDPTYRYPHAKAAEVLLEQGQLGAAAHAIVMSVPEGKNPVDTTVLRVRRLADKGLFAAADTEISRALAEAPGNEKLLIARARLRLRQEKKEEARQILEGILEARPDSPKALVELALMAAREGDQHKAMDLLDRAEAHAGSNLAERVHRAPAFFAAGKTSALARRAAAFRGHASSQRRTPSR